MTQQSTSTAPEPAKEVRSDPTSSQGDRSTSGPPVGGGMFQQYKPEQGKWIRMSTFVGFGVMIAWGAVFLFGEMSVFQGDEAWRFMFTHGIPIIFAVGLGALAWWASFGNRKTGDFMIATEGEMKKVNWSSRREIIGSTKVVIMFTALMAITLFIVDLLFQTLFSAIGVLKS